MAALTLRSTTSSALSSHRLIFHRRLDRPKRNFSALTLLAPPRFRVCCASIGRPRSGKKPLSNVELRNEIKDFLSSFGLPEDHVPSTKELSLHGRNDLANIVRRRGYKLMRELLTNSVQMDVDGTNGQLMLADKQAEAAPVEIVEQLEGQDEKAEDFSVQTNLSDEVSVGEQFSVRPDERPIVSFFGDEYTDEGPLHIQYSYGNSTLFHGDGVTDDRNSSSGVVDIEENSVDLDLNMDPSSNNIEYVPLETPGDLESVNDASSSFMDEVQELDYDAENVSSPTKTSIEENYPQNYDLDSVVDARISREPQGTNALEEKVRKFMEDGYLDPVEDNLSGTYNEVWEKQFGLIGSSESINSEKGLDIPPETPAEEPPVHLYGTQHATRFNPGSSPAEFDHPLGDNRSSDGEVLDAHVGKIAEAEIIKGENQAEISRLRYMLHQKELELTRLKEEIEKEKLALTSLQAKAENEINKAQKLISEKDAELQAAEEGLSGLKEVEIQYCGDGGIVEVAGSFNGWHHRIKMDPKPLESSSTNGAGSRESRLWSTMLWLYPGAYEIKFVVDGQWVVDPKMESTTKGSISNNILRVDR